MVIDSGSTISVPLTRIVESYRLHCLELCWKTSAEHAILSIQIIWQCRTCDKIVVRNEVHVWFPHWYFIPFIIDIVMCPAFTWLVSIMKFKMIATRYNLDGIFKESSLSHFLTIWNRNLMNRSRFPHKSIKMISLWMKHSLVFLVYYRTGGRNDHVFRHPRKLFMSVIFILLLYTF